MCPYFSTDDHFLSTTAKTSKCHCLSWQNVVRCSDLAWSWQKVVFCGGSGWSWQNMVFCGIQATSQEVGSSQLQPGPPQKTSQEHHRPCSVNSRGDHLPSTLAKNTTEDHVLSAPAQTRQPVLINSSQDLHRRPLSVNYSQDIQMSLLELTFQIPSHRIRSWRHYCEWHPLFRIPLPILVNF